MKSDITIRKLEKPDIQECVCLFMDTVHTINAKDYSEEQLDVWAPELINFDDIRWKSITDNIALVAIMDNIIVGFADMDHAGYLDRLYVHKSFQRRGIASALVKALEGLANAEGIRNFTTEASITARPFFEKIGYTIVIQQEKDVQGVGFINFIMKKTIE